MGRPRFASNAPAFTVLQDRDFRALWYVGGIHEISRRMEMLILSWLILQTTDSPFQLGLVLVFNNLPRPFFSLFSGLVADRFSRYRVIFLAQAVNTVTAGAILALIMAGSIAPWHVFLAVFVQGLTKALDDPSRRTAILDIVGSGGWSTPCPWTRLPTPPGSCPARCWEGCSSTPWISAALISWWSSPTWRPWACSSG